MESKDSDVWTKGEPVTIQKNCLFLRKGVFITLGPGNLIIPLDEPSERSIKLTTAGKIYTWIFLLPDGSITEFFLHTTSYVHSKNLRRKVSNDMKQYFVKSKKK